MCYQFVICLLMSVLISALAQETTGGIRGLVSDATGAGVPGAKLQAASATLVRPAETTTDSAGAYLFGSLPPGEYTLTVTAPGFATAKRHRIDLALGALLKIDFPLEVGVITENLVVTGEAPLVDVSRSAVASNVTREFLDRLPRGRSYMLAVSMAPGARSEGKAGGYQIDGSSGSENVWVIEGVDVTNLQTGTQGSANMPPEFVQEVQVKSSGFEAQYGGSTGGVVNVVLRSGANSIHGQGSLAFITDGMSASIRPYLRLNPTNDNVADYFFSPKDDSRTLYPGGAVSGPLKKNRLWFFASYYPSLYRAQRTVTFLVNNQTDTFVTRTKSDQFAGKLDFSPWQKLRTSFTYLYQPSRTRGTLPSREGTGSPKDPYRDRGGRSPVATYSFAADYMATSKLLFSVRGGHNYRNYKNYGVPRGIYYSFQTTNINMRGPDGQPLPVPAHLQAPRGAFTPSNSQTVKDIQSRSRISADVSYLASFAGQHHLRAGYETNRLHTDVAAGYVDGAILLYWNVARRGIVVPGTMRGRYGYYIYRVSGTFGNVGSDNMSFYLQDGWQIARRLRLNLGLRTEREFLPSISTGPGFSSRPIEFGFGEKLAPRLGVAWDVLGDSRLKLYGGFGLFYDLMKYELPLGGFGGDVWKDYVYPLDDPDFTKISPTNTPGQLFEAVDWRIPSNDPRDNRIDPALKPMRQRAWDFGADYALTPHLSFAARYTRKSVDRTVEDVGVLTPQGEAYYITNPGFGLSVDPAILGPGMPLTPRAKRVYDALELRAEKRFSRSFQFLATYTWSRLFGNYSGLASSDESGRTSPNVERYFDLPYLSYNAKGQLVEGRLATDRPHTFKFFGAYTLKTKLGETNFGPTFYAYSGSPLTTEVVMVSMDIAVPVNGRGDMGRTPVYTNTNMYVYHEFKAAERYRARVEFNFSNLFNQSFATNSYVRYNHTADGVVQFKNPADFFKGFDYKALMQTQKMRVDPRYGLPSAFQGGRGMLMGLHFYF